MKTVLTPNQPLNDSNRIGNISSGFLLLLHILYSIVFAIVWLFLSSYNGENQWKNAGEASLMLLLPMYLFLTTNFFVFLVNLASFGIFRFKKIHKFYTLPKYWIIFGIANIFWLISMIFMSLGSYTLITSISYPIITLIFYLLLKKQDFPIVRLFLWIVNIFWLVLMLKYDTPTYMSIVVLAYPVTTLLTLLPIQMEENNTLEDNLLNNLNLRSKLNVLSLFVAVNNFNSRSKLNVLSLFVAVFIFITFCIVYLIINSFNL